jgi:glycosyltransferase involved in cell wall biosynthesis
VHFLGAVDDSRHMLHATEVLVLTSPTEGMPGVAIEAGLCGVPVAATDVDATQRVVVGGYTGYLVPRQQRGAVTVALKQALDTRAPRGACLV